MECLAGKNLGTRTRFEQYEKDVAPPTHDATRFLHMPRFRRSRLIRRALPLLAAVPFLIAAVILVPDLSSATSQRQNHPDDGGVPAPEMPTRSHEGAGASQRV